MASSLRICVAAASLVTLASPAETIEGPSSPAVQPQWLANITAQRNAQLASVAFNPVNYNNYLPWTTSLYVAPQSHLYDRFLYDTEASMWTVDRFLDDLEIRYGGIDGVLLWASYPNMGVDERNQFDLLSDLPGGFPALANAIARFHARGVRVGLPENPWDTGTARPDGPDYDVMAAIAIAVGSDWVNGDTMSYMDPGFFTAPIAVGHPIALQPEGGPNLQSLNWTHMGWGYWDNPFVPPVGMWKWTVTGAQGLRQGAGHMTQICDRWSTNHTSDIQQAWFNGIGFVSWENVWGIWNGMTPRDSEATRRFGALSRFFSAFLTSHEWEPHTLLVQDASATVFASRWPLPAGVFSPNNATFWTIVNRGSVDYSGLLLNTACADSSTQFWDVYQGVQITPAPVAGGGCAVALPVEGEGFSGVLAIASADITAALTTFLQKMAAMTVQPLSSFSTAQVLLQQSMTDWGMTTPVADAPAGMTLVPSLANWTFHVSGTEIEGWPQDWAISKGVDVQFPWESVSQRVHAPYNLSIPAFYMDTLPVTNTQYSAFLVESGYAPSDTHNFLNDWNCSWSTRKQNNATTAACPFPTGWDSKPVTWVDMVDSSAYCSFYGKRLPNDWEWQLAAQGPDGRNFPWGWSFDQTRVPVQQIGTSRPAPPDVGSYPSGVSPYGLQDMMGLVWQWTNEFTDEHTRAGLTRGGAWYRASTSTWYYPGDLINADKREFAYVTTNTHNKMLLMSSSYDRHGTVGFRCVTDTLMGLPVNQ